MIINLKQNEIEQALRAYVVAQGISLHGKDLTISFTAGRREAGISAEISIDDVEIPGFTHPVTEDFAPKAQVVQLAPAVATVTPVEPIVDAASNNEPVPEVQAEVEEAPVVEAKPTVSLFG